MRAKPFSLMPLSIILLAALAGCSAFNNATPTPTPTETPTPVPTLTPTPEIPLAILVLPADMDANMSNLYQSTVYDLTQQAGYRFQVRNNLSAADLEPSLKVVIALPPDAGIAALAAAAPQAQFLAVNIPGLSAGGNLSVLGVEGIPAEIPAFLAGYIGAMLTEDYHLGFLMPKDNPEAQKAAQAYDNGMVFYCGLCNPWAGPFYEYPIWQDIPVDEKPENYDAYADVLIIQRHVEMIYTYPDIATPDLLYYISTTGAWQIGTQLPQKQLSGWVATIQPDVIHAIQTAWPDLIAGSGGRNVASPLVLADVNPELLSPGKQRLAGEVLNELLAGRISTGVQ